LFGESLIGTEVKGNKDVMLELITHTERSVQVSAGCWWTSW